MMNVKFKDWSCVSAWGRYANGELALTLLANGTQKGAFDGEQVAVATVHLYDPPPPTDQWDPTKQIWVKAWSENEGMYEALEKAGIIEECASPFTWRAGYINAVLGTLTPAALEEIEETKKRDRGEA